MWCVPLGTEDCDGMQQKILLDKDLDIVLSCHSKWLGKGQKLNKEQWVIQKLIYI